MKKSLVIIAIVIVGFLSLLPQPQLAGENKVVTAALPEGKWTFDAFTIDAKAFYSTNSICIQPGGKWSATSSGQGSGNWYLKDRKLLLHGNYASSSSGGAVNVSFELNFQGNKQMTGFLQEWNDNGTYNGYYLTEWKLISEKC